MPPACRRAPGPTPADGPRRRKSTVPSASTSEQERADGQSRPVGAVRRRSAGPVTRLRRHVPALLPAVDHQRRCARRRPGSSARHPRLTFCAHRDHRHRRHQRPSSVALRRGRRRHGRRSTRPAGATAPGRAKVTARTAGTPGAGAVTTRVVGAVEVDGRGPAGTRGQQARRRTAGEAMPSRSSRRLLPHAQRRPEPQPMSTGVVGQRDREKPRPVETQLADTDADRLEVPSARSDRWPSPRPTHPHVEPRGAERLEPARSRCSSRSTVWRPPGYSSSSRVGRAAAACRSSVHPDRPHGSLAEPGQRQGRVVVVLVGDPRRARIAVDRRHAPSARASSTAVDDACTFTSWSRWISPWSASPVDRATSAATA